ncbi:hypothetical protein [Ruminococcus albus]|nr:hypothetical protein [Ruminococcus albus]
MSKEVEVTGIKMTASVPENIQVSLGAGTNGTAGLTGASFVEANDGSTRTLTVTTPSVADGTTDWTNTVAISDYYTFGRLTPATSKDGNDIFFTSDATRAGRALLQDTYDANQKALTGKSYAAFVQADTAATSKYQAWTEPNDVTGASMTTTTKGATTNVTIADIDKTGGGYYVDIPVWFRTSITGAENENVQLAVIATITPKKTGATADAVTTPDLYLAARCALIPSGGSAVGAIMDSTTKYYHTEEGAVDSVNGYAPASAYTVNAATDNSTAPTWVQVDPVTQATTAAINDGIAGDGEAVVLVPKSTSTSGEYGSAAAYTLRVWLEGEDVNCWDETAAQDFQIDLRFIRKS